MQRRIKETRKASRASVIWFNNYVAKALYENIGFSSTGVEDEDEIELVMNV